jgi:hypothetical protein
MVGAKAEPQFDAFPGVTPRARAAFVAYLVGDVERPAVGIATL